MQSQCFIEVENLDTFVRYVCAFRQHPYVVYSHQLGKQRVLSSGVILSSTLLSFYTPLLKKGQYVSYMLKNGKEHCDVANSTKQISNYAPIVHQETISTPLKTNVKKIKDQFKPIEISDLASLARMAYDPNNPDEPDLALFLFAHKKNWVLGKITSIDMDDTVYCFNYVTLKNEPTKPFLRYSSQNEKEPEFTDKFEHGYLYNTIIKLKKSHPIFGLK